MKKKIRLIVFLFVILSGCETAHESWFVVNRLDDRTYIISEPRSSQGNSSFLIIGDREAILFDSGSGEQKGERISDITDSITKIPVTLVLSHFHFDHIGNVKEFKGIGLQEIAYLNEEVFADRVLHLSESEVLSEDTISINIIKFLPTDKPIDLGSRSIEILHTPGHSPESITVIDHNNKYVFIGDLLYNGLLLVNDCQAYVSSINKVLEKIKPDYRVFGSHGRPEVPYEKLKQTAHAIQCYQQEDCHPDSVKQIKLMGTDKAIHFKDHIAFIEGYRDAFLKQ